ncbi:protein FANTASTIC FOUR 4-like [Ipomoea triloba]|uniref:protein FANTASTIC FOUR 4-like n=1 Tax=Ipomoea triloba TaxID=35885 RepID=UPI00125E9222|nr:protein FANTASTIC FOUR 4-like [Ipomoea triloba]
MAAACGSLKHMFDNPLPENPTLLESLSSSLKQIQSMNPLQDSSLTEIFGELHFKEHHSSSSPLSSSASSSSLFSVDTHTQNPQWLDKEKTPNHSDSTSYYHQYKHGGHHDFSSKNSDSLSLCTEGLGFESSDDIEDSNDVDHDWLVSKERPSFSRHELKRSRLGKGPFPPPISSIGRSGKPWVCFRSFREDGRFILKEIRIPTQEFLRACREDGRLKLQLIQSDDEIPEDEEEEEEQEDDNDTEDIQEVKDDDFQAEGNDREEENIRNQQ